MNEKWEICHVEPFEKAIEFLHPDRTKNRTIAPSTFMKEHGANNSWTTIEYREVISILLMQGWEPYAVAQSPSDKTHYQFRRRVG